MATKWVGAAAAALCAAVVICAGCSGDKSVSPANVSGLWTGPLTLSYAGGGATSAGLTLRLEQQEDFASGVADWAATETTRPATAAVDADQVTLRLHFRCAQSEVDNPVPTRIEYADITGTVSGATLTFSGATGFACPGGGLPQEVSGASGAVTRVLDGQPL